MTCWVTEEKIGGISNNTSSNYDFYFIYLLFFDFFNVTDMNSK